MQSTFNHVNLLAFMITFFVLSCKNEPKRDEKLNVLGNYVSDYYSERSEGYDWLSVSVTEAENDELNISIRSRADQKKPTCTFDAIAKKIDSKTYKAQNNGHPILFQFTNNEIDIIAEKEEDEGLLYFYCSGGASIKGTYSKINETLDQNQIDKTQFNKVLNFQNIGFNISSIERNGIKTLTIFTFGLEQYEYNETFDIEGEKVTKAAVEDIDSDGSPELFICTQSVGSGSYGSVYVFSVNNRKSMSQVYFKPTEENSKINHGYMGHDEFLLIEKTFNHRFPVYKKGDINAEPTGGIRQVSYKLVEGETMKMLEVDKITEY